jgi:hypothetical protein
MPPHPSLAMLASLAAIALDAAVRKQPYNPVPVGELARVLNERLGVVPRGEGSQARLIDPVTTGLLIAVLKSDEHTMEALAREGAEMAAALELPLDKHDRSALLNLRDFALRLSSAAQRFAAADPLDRSPSRVP